MNKKVILYLVVLIFILQTLSVFALENDDTEALFNPWYKEYATGRMRDFNERGEKYDWILPIDSMGHLISSYQNYGSSPYFHHGIDLRAPSGTTVKTTSGGRIVNIEKYGSSDLYWEVAVEDDDGFIWQFHHIDKNSIPQNIHDAYQSGVRVAAGTVVGKIVYWSTASFHHIHLNILGEGGKYMNPLNFFKPLPDTQEPEIVEIGLLKNGNKYTSNTISGNYSLFTHVRDLMMHTSYYLPPYLLTYSLDGGPEHTVWKFDDLPGGSSKTAYVNDFFVPSMVCGNYSCRKMVIDLGFDKGGNKNFTTDPGPHTIVVTATDYYGNTTSRDFSWNVSGIKADFTYVEDNRKVTFSDKSFSDSSITGWSWNFGDGNNSSQKNPVHIYSADGTYDVRLTVTDSNGKNTSVTKPVTVKQLGTPTPTPTATPIYINKAIKRPIVVSGVYSASYPKEAAVDNDMNSAWGTSYNAGPQWAYVTLDKAYFVDHVIIEFYDPYIATDVYIGISDDGVNWDLPGHTGGNNNSTVKIPVGRTTQYIGVYFAAMPLNVCGVKEFKVMVKVMPQTPTPTATPIMTPTPTAQQTPTPTAIGGTWKAGVSYSAGDEVTYNGKSWICSISHTSQIGWEPGTPGVHLWREK